MMHRPWQRLLVFAFLAGGMAHAINKLFIPELEADADVYARLMEGTGHAPDQYRILPIMLLYPFTALAGWSHGVLISNFIAGIFVLLQLWNMAAHRGIQVQTAQSFLFAVVFIFTLITGWRPETLWVLVIFNLTIPWINEYRVSWIRFFLGLFLLSLARADVAVWISAALLARNLKDWKYAIAGIGLGIGIQYLLMKIVFPEAAYYTHVVMILDNLSGWYLFRNPATYFILAALLIWRVQLISWFRNHLDAENQRLLLACVLYVILIFMIGRINEYRLYLWFLPVFWWIDRKNGTVEHA